MVLACNCRSSEPAPSQAIGSPLGPVAPQLAVSGFEDGSRQTAGQTGGGAIRQPASTPQRGGQVSRIRVVGGRHCGPAHPLRLGRITPGNRTSLRMGCGRYGGRGRSRTGRFEGAEPNTAASRSARSSAESRRGCCYRVPPGGQAGPRRAQRATRAGPGHGGEHGLGQQLGGHPPYF